MAWKSDDNIIGREQSEFNMAIANLARIHNFLMVADDASYRLDVSGWFQALQVLYREAARKMKKEEREELEKRINVIRNKVNMYVQSRSFSVGFIPSDVYDDLNKFDIDLRDILEEAGMMDRAKDDLLAPVHW